MQVVRSGFILYTLNYSKCVAFYRDVLKLKILYDKDALTCFEFYGSYLLVEVDDEHLGVESSVPKRDRTCIRLNVENVREACKILDQNNIPYSYSEREWGAIAKFRDPDENLIGFRSAKEHEDDRK